MKHYSVLSLLIIAVSFFASCSMDRCTNCSMPLNTSVSSISYSSAIVVWQRVRDAKSYTVRYRQLGTNPWHIGVTPYNSFSIARLLPSTLYEWQVQSQCRGDVSDFSIPNLFKTDTIIHSVYIPNAFSPNGDGVNDVFSVSSPLLSSLNMQIYNRWGDEVYNSGTSQWAGWDGTYMGTMQPAGTYLFFISLVYIDGYTQTRQGYITLNR